jgi:2-dehydropantoate 2-reductase
MKFERICVVGVGGVGGYFGGKMAYFFERQPEHRRQVYFVARGPHLACLQRDGLVLNTPNQAAITCRPTRATDNVLELPTPDLYLVCVKSYDLSAVIRAIQKNMYAETVVLPLLNGVDICERIRSILAIGIVLPACVYIGTHIDRPGVVTQHGGDGTILCGPDALFPRFDPQELSGLFMEADLKLVWNSDPYPAIWQKYIFIAGFGLVTAHSGKTLGQIIADETCRKQVCSIMAEIVVIARRKGILLPDNIVEASWNKASNFPPETKTSYQRDIETAGKRDEGELFGGTVIQISKQEGIPTPVTSALYADIQKRRMTQG